MDNTFFKNESDDKPQGAIPDLDDNISGGEQTSSGTKEYDVNRMAIILSYIPFLCFIPLVNLGDNKEVRFHARQGVMLFLIELVAAIFLIDGISDFIFKVILIAALAFSVAGIVFGLQGKEYRIPYISDLLDKTKL